MRVQGLAHLEPRQFRNPKRAILPPHGGRRPHPLRVPGREQASQRHEERSWRLLMSFANYCLFATAAPVLEGPGVTVSFACEFLDAAREGELVEGFGEVTRAGGSMIFLRGILTSGERKLFTFSGTLKRVKWRSPPAASNDAG